MAAATTNDFDQKMMKKAIMLLHSKHPDSATELRMMLDELIKQRYGAEKMICNTMLTPRILELEKNFPGRATTPPPEPEKPAEVESTADEVINLTNSPVKTISDSPETMIVDSDDDTNLAVAGGGIGTIPSVEDDGNLKDFGDLNCCVCGEMMFTATNRLIECSKCGALYHQECHKPPISDEEVAEQEHNWQCDICFNKPSTSKAAGIVVIPDEPISLISKSKSSATSSRSSSSNSSPYIQEPAVVAEPPAPPASSTTTTTTTSKHHHHHKSSTSSSSKPHKEKEERSTKSSASEKSSSTHMPRKSSHSSKSSSSKSSSSSRHHESSSKRKSLK